MAAQRNRKRKDFVDQLDKGTTVLANRQKVKTKRKLARGKVKEQVSLRSDKARAKSQETLKTAQAMLKDDCRARAKVKKTLAEFKKL